MAFVQIGTGDGNYPRTPTLRQYLKEKDGVCPSHSFVKVLFKPKDYPTWTLVCEHGFKVNIYEESPVYGILFDEIETYMRDESALFLVITDKEKAEFSIGVNTDENAEWEERNFGYTAKILPKKNRPTQNRSTRKKGTSDDSGGGLSA